MRREFNFEFAVLIFDGPMLEREDTRHHYGERRVIATGLAEGVYLTVVYTDRRFGAEDVERRIISARRSNRGERRVYAEAYPRKAEPGAGEP
jgi:uncharacterized DUF497 family protein